MSEFRRALAITLRFEGGYANHPNDPGGATMKGVTQAVYDDYRKSLGQPKADVKHISDAEVETIYHRRYWLDGGCDQLPPLVSLVHFDACVNHGIENATKLLQRAVGVADDGKIGPRTLAAVSASDPAALVNAQLWERLAFYERIALRRQQMRVFLLGWLSRVNALRREVH